MSNRNRPAPSLFEDCRHFLSHDLKSPVMVVEGYGQQLVDRLGPQLGINGLRYVDRMRRATRDFSRQAEQLLVLMDVASRRMERTTVDLGAISGRLIESLWREHPGRVVDFHVEPGLTCECDLPLMMLVMSQLIDNAWKFTSRCATAVIRVGRIQPPGEAALFFVEDNGAGFDPAYTDSLFRASHRLHGADEFPGLGMGLAIAREAVSRHRGTIRAEGRLGEGSRFLFTLDEPACWTGAA